MGDSHGRRAKTGYPFCHQVRCHFRQARSGGITGIRSHAGVDMNIDKPRDYHTAREVDFFLPMEIRGNVGNPLPFG